MRFLSILFVGLFALPVWAFDSRVEHVVDSVVSVFENDTPVLQYDYIENIHDGRGFTAGRSGFTTATGDLYMVVERYLKTVKDDELALLVPVLLQRARDGSASLKDLSRLPAIWRRCSLDPVFRKVQDEINFELNKQPAIEALQITGLKTPLAYLIFYDTILQQGLSDSDDGFADNLKRAGAVGENETEFLGRFLAAREQILLHPKDPGTADAWIQSVDRVRALRRLLVAGELQLQTPLKLIVWGETFSISGQKPLTNPSTKF